ncbi:MAG: hypothetical protein J0L93_07450 [Deltaproteobacteria bacterium]|nr:hypothetical protein [Deltaproteobacteria bacterium]
MRQLKTDRYKDPRLQNLNDALKRLKGLLRAAPEMTSKIHLYLHREKGIRLLDDLLEKDESVSHSSRIH